MPATRFMRQLEVPIRQGENVAAVDLFDRQHARSVLTKFGQAYGRLPDRGIYGPVLFVTLLYRQAPRTELALFGIGFGGRPGLSHQTDRLGDYSGLAISRYLAGLPPSVVVAGRCRALMPGRTGIVGYLWALAAVYYHLL